MIRELFETIYYPNFFVSAVLFLLGIYLAPMAVEKDIKWLLAYPRWLFRKMEPFLKPGRSFFTMFGIIFFLNNLSLFTSFLSGFLIIGPLCVSFLTGLNVAVISYDMMGWKGIWHTLVNPVSWLEFPAAWISFALGFRLSESILFEGGYQAAAQSFATLSGIYLKYVVSLLLIAGLLESLLIRLAERLNGDNNE